MKLLLADCFYSWPDECIAADKFNRGRVILATFLSMNEGDWSDEKMKAVVGSEPGANNTYWFPGSIVESLEDSIVTIDLNGIITSWNRAAERLYGYTAREAIGQSLEIVTTPHDLLSLFEKVNAIKSGQTIAVYNTLRITKSQDKLQIEVRLSPMFNQERHMIGVSKVARDVTEIRKTEAALAASEARHRAVLEAATDFAIIAMDRNGNITDWNSGAQLMFGHHAEDVIGKHTELIFTPEDREGNMAQVEIALAEAVGRSLDERWHLHKDGTRFFMSGVMTRIEDPATPGYVKVARNITDRKIAEEALFLSEQRKSLAVQSAGMGEWEWNLITDNIKTSPLVYELFGLAEDGGQPRINVLYDYVYPPDQAAVEEQLQLALDGLHVFQAEYRIIPANNRELRWVNAYGRVVAHTEGKPSKMIGVVYDITARKLLEKQKEDFIGMASHELKTPVTAIKAYGELLGSRMIETQSDDDLIILRKLNGQIDRLIQLMQMLLDSGNLSDGNIQLHPEPIALTTLIDDYLQTLAITIPSHRVVAHTSPTAVVHADRGRISQVLANLVSNAIKYSPAGSDIIVRTKDIGEAALVSVEDFGVGISTESQPYIFDRYYRVPDESYRREGFGLGLYICSQIIRQHHGSIWVESEPGKGSVFSFTLPYS